MPTIHLFGRLEDGTSLLPTLPATVRRTLDVVRGDTYTFDLSILTPAGVPVDLSDKTVTLTVKRSTEDAVATCRVTSGPDRTGQGAQPAGRVLLPLVVPANVPPGQYVWDVWISGVDYPAQQVVPVGYFRISRGLRDST